MSELPVQRETLLLKEREPDVLFICQANVGRSQMAEGFFNAMAQGKFVATSAGVDGEFARKVYDDLPHIQVREAMKQAGVRISDQKVKGLTKKMLEQADRIVVLCDPEILPIYSLEFNNKMKFYPIDDPSSVSSGSEGKTIPVKKTQSIEQARDQIKEIVERVLEEIRGEKDYE